MMDLSKIQITNLWAKLSNKIKHRAFPTTTFVNSLHSKSEILALFSKNGEDTNQLQQLGFIICTKTIFTAHTNNSVSDQGIISNDYFSGEIIDVNKNIIPNVYIHLVKVMSGPIVINNISLYLNMHETFHYGLVKNKIGAQLFTAQLAKQLSVKNNFFNSVTIDNERFSLTIEKLNLNRKILLQCEEKLNLLLQQKLGAQELLKISKNKAFDYLKTIHADDLQKINIFNKIAIISIKNIKKTWQIVAITGDDEEIENFFLEAKKPLINVINNINKKIKTINQPEVIKPMAPITNINSYENLLSLQKIAKKLNNDFKKWRLASQDVLESMAKNFAFSYFSEVIDDLRIAHYSFNNDLLDYNLMEIKGRALLTNLNDTLLFLSNNISDNPSMIILLSANLMPKYDLKVIVTKLTISHEVKIIFKDDIIILSTTQYQYITEFISSVITLLKSDNFKHYLQLPK